MAEKLINFAQQLKGFWNVLSSSKKLVLLFATTAALIGVLATALLGSQLKYDYLYTELTPEDAAAITEKLKEMKIPHRFAAGGTALEVPSDQVYALRAQLASAGLPRGGGVGFEIFDQTSLGATEFEQHVKLRRALEGELGRSIASLEGVKAARVHLVMPERRLFAAKTEAASASIVVKLASRHDFDRQDVAGIVHLVASAVPGLSHDRVSVVSTDGKTLHRPNAGGASGATDGQVERVLEVGSQLEQHVRSLLERVTGPGAVDVRVRVELDSASREMTEEHYEPTKTVLRSEHKSEEAAGREEATVAGVPGAQENLPDVQAAVPAEEQVTDGDVYRRAHTRNWEVDRVTQKTLRPAGDVARLSVAVLVDGVYEQADGQPVYKPRDPQELQSLASIVRSAVGFNESRGDTVLVEGARFARVELEEVAQTPLPWWERFLPHAAAVVSALFIVIVLTMALRHRRRLRSTIVAVEQKMRQQELLRIESEERKRQEDERALLEQEEAVGLLEHMDTENALIRRQEALEVAAKDPATAAVVLKAWLNQDGPTPHAPASS